MSGQDRVDGGAEAHARWSERFTAWRSENPERAALFDRPTPLEGEEGMRRSVVVCATSDQPALVRLKAAFTALPPHDPDKLELIIGQLVMMAVILVVVIPVVAGSRCRLMEEAETAGFPRAESSATWTQPARR